MTDHAFLLRCMPRVTPEQAIISLARQNLPESLHLSKGQDSFGNTTLAGWIPEGHAQLSYQVSGVVRRDDSRRAKEDCLPCYRYHSPLGRPQT